jgi:hypothetical protein
MCAGSALVALQAFLDQKLGPQGYTRALRELPPDRSAPVGGILLPVSRYPTESYFALLHAAAPLVGEGFCEEFGEFAAEFEIHSIWRIILHFTSPAAFVERSGRLWSRFHDSGTWTVESKDKRIRGTLRDFALVDAFFCRVMGAWIQRAGRMSAARFEVHHPECRAHGAAACVFTGAW